MESMSVRNGRAAEGDECGPRTFSVLVDSESAVALQIQSTALGFALGQLRTRLPTERHFVEGRQSVVFAGAAVRSCCIFAASKSCAVRQHSTAQATGPLVRAERGGGREARAEGGGAYESRAVASDDRTDHSPLRRSANGPLAEGHGGCDCTAHSTDCPSDWNTDGGGGLEGRSAAVCVLQ
jgi:hypothetical protein